MVEDFCVPATPGEAVVDGLGSATTFDLRLDVVLPATPSFSSV